MEEEYRPVVWKLPDDYLSYDHFVRVVRKLDMTSSPGYPYYYEAPTVGEWLQWDGFTVSQYALDRLWFEVNAYLEQEEQDSIFLTCFIKQEPHKLSKRLEKRYRLIMASPLHVQIVWTMLFGYQNDLEIEKTYEIPSQQGLVFPNGGWKSYYRQWTSKGFNTGLDKVAWDWNAPIWLINMDLDFRYRMGRGVEMDGWLRIAKRLYHHMFNNPIIIMPNGNAYKQVIPGIMKSGCVNTISTNSHMQGFVHVEACRLQGVSYLPMPACCGDDTLQKLEQATDISCYARLGAIVKSASEGMEFVGHEILSTGPVPIYFSKHLAKFERVSDDNVHDYVDSMCRMYCKSPLFDFWNAAASYLGVSVYSRQYYNYWYDNEEVF